MGNRPREDQLAMRIARDTDFQDACDRAYAQGVAMEAAERAARIEEYENSPEQREWEHDDACESEFITEAGMYSPCQCKERDAE